MLDLTNQIIIGVAGVAVPALIAALGGYIVSKVEHIFPSLTAILSAQRVAQGEEALSNAVIADVSKGTPFSLNTAITQRMNTISPDMASAMAKAGTTPAQLVARITGNVITKLPPATALVAPTGA